MMLVHVLSEKVGATRPLPFKAAVERDGYFESELMASPNGPHHMFGDVKSFYRPDVLRHIQDLQAKNIDIPLTALVPLVKRGKAATTSAWCSRCNKVCEHPRCTLHQGSPSCMDCAHCGTKDGITGLTMPDLAAWAAMRRALKEPFTIV